MLLQNIGKHMPACLLTCARAARPAVCQLALPVRRLAGCRLCPPARPLHLSDGEPAARFLGTVRELLEAPYRLLV